MRCWDNALSACRKLLFCILPGERSRSISESMHRLAKPVQDCKPSKENACFHSGIAFEAGCHAVDSNVDEAQTAPLDTSTCTVMVPKCPNRSASVQIEKTRGRRGDIVVMYAWRHGPCGRAGLKLGDVILAVDGRQATDVGDVTRALEGPADVCLTVRSSV